MQPQYIEVGGCQPEVLLDLEEQFIANLRGGLTLLEWAGWLQKLLLQHLTRVCSLEDPHSVAQAARDFLSRWTYATSLIFRDLTLRSSPSFGSFHLLRLVCACMFVLFLWEENH